MHLCCWMKKRLKINLEPLQSQQESYRTTGGVKTLTVHVVYGIGRNITLTHTMKLFQVQAEDLHPRH